MFSHAWMRRISGSEPVLPISTVQLTVAGVIRAWVSAENVLGIEEDVVAEDVGAVGAAPVQAAAKTQKPMTTYRICCPPAGFRLGSPSQKVCTPRSVVMFLTPIGAD